MLSTAAPVEAAAIYTYTGNSFTTTFLSGLTTPADIYTTADRITGFFELAAPLPGGFGGSVSPLSFSFADGVNTLTSAMGPSSVFNVATDSAGNITAWSVGVEIFSPEAGGGIEQAISTFYLPGVGSFDIATDIACGPASTPTVCGPSYAQQARVGTPGTWQLQVTPPSVPEPTSVLLLGAALAGLAIRRRR